MAWGLVLGSEFLPPPQLHHLYIMWVNNMSFSWRFWEKLLHSRLGRVWWVLGALGLPCWVLLTKICSGHGQHPGGFSVHLSNCVNAGKSHGPCTTAKSGFHHPKPFKGDVISSYWKRWGKGRKQVISRGPPALPSPLLYDSLYQYLIAGSPIQKQNCCPPNSCSLGILSWFDV